MKLFKTEHRKNDHISLCLTDDVSFKGKTNGFENYEFLHYPITEVDINKIDLSKKYFNKKISLPFLISCMTGGTFEAEKINEKLAIAANILNIPIGVGSQRQALENSTFLNSYKVVRKNAGNVPVLGNLGAAQIVKSKTFVDDVKKLADLIEADQFVIHINPLQELIQKEGEPSFSGLLKNITKLASNIEIPIIVKEVGSGISKEAAKKLLECGVKGIDVAGAGGTSWAAVELLRNKSVNNYFHDWGLSTSYCIRSVNELRKNYKFVLIASGGISNGIEIAKSIALGADITASARIILRAVVRNGVDGVVNLIQSWFDDVKKIMYLTGAQKLDQLKQNKLTRKSELY
jgi:isopentenyl-diphosphate delta-isomerase